MRHPLPFAVSFALAAMLAFFVTSVALASPAEAAPPLPPAPAAGSVETTNSADEVTAVRQPSAPLDIPSTGITVTVDIPLTAGWNLVAIPVKRMPAHTAQSALNEITGQGGACTEVNRWLNGGWDAFINGLPFNNFSLEPGKGYFVRCTTSSTWSVTGELIMAPVPLELTPGWNLVALPYGPHADQAQAWLNDIIAQGGAATEVNRWLNGGWDAFINGLPFNNFEIAKTQGYFVRMGNGASYLPKPPTQPACGAISADVTWTSDKVWLLTCGVTINTGVTLTIESGTIVKSQNANVGLYVRGAIAAPGSELERVVITAFKDDRFGGDTNNDGSSSLPSRGAWQHIRVDPTGRATLDYAAIYYGGNAGTLCGNLTVNGGTVALSHVVVEEGRRYGIYASGGVVSVHASSIEKSLGGIYVSDAVLSVESSTIADNSFNGVNVADPRGAVTLRNNDFSRNGGTAAAIASNVGHSYLRGDGTITNNHGNNNGLNGISVSGEITGSVHLAANELPYVPGRLVVPAEQSLTIDAGTVLKFRDSQSILRVNGTAVAQATSGQEVVFTSIKDDSVAGDTNSDGTASLPFPRDWEGIIIGSTGMATFDHIVVRYAGSAYSNASPAGIYVDGGYLALTNSTLERNNRSGLMVNSTISPLIRNNNSIENLGYAFGITSGTEALNLWGDEMLTGNTGSSNVIDAIYLDARFVGESRLVPNPGLPYAVDDLAVASGYSLALDPGTVLKFETEGQLIVNGTLEAEGQPGQEVVFTSIKDDSISNDSNRDESRSMPIPGDWMGIYVTESGTSTLNHSVVRYGGHGWRAANVYVQGGVFDASASVFSFSSQHGIRSSGLATVRNSVIHSNAGYGLYNENYDQQVDARSNNWGFDSGPFPYGSGNGINFRICYDSVQRVYYICEHYVDVDPWIGKEYFVQSGFGFGGPGTRNQMFVADPVNTANGNYAYNYTDLSIPTRGLPLAVSRAYNSLAPLAGPLGWGWTHNWHVFLTEDADGSAMVTFGDGHAEKWTWSGSDYQGAPGIYGILVKNGDGTFDLTQKDQTRYRFSAAGQLAWVEDRNANRTTLAYDGSGKLISVSEPAGRTLTFQYASPIDPNLISSISDHVSRSTQYAYDSASNLVAITDVMGQVTTMVYDGNHRLLTMTDANIHTFVNNTYDDRGRVSQQRDAYGKLWIFAYDEESRFTRVTDPLNRETVYTYDGEWRVVSEKDALTFTVSYAYDAAGNRTRVTDKRGNPTFFAYDGRGNTTVITDTLGGVASMTYDTSGVRNNLLSQTDALGRTTSYTYDARSNLEQRTDPPTSACPAGCVTAWSYDSFGQPASVTDANGRVTLTAYDAYGNLLAITDALGGVTSAAYDTAGRKLQETDALGRITTYTYDLANRLLTVAEPLGKTTAYAYDNVGNRTQITENGTRITGYAYDHKDRLASVTDPLGHTTTYGYDDVDNQISATDALGHATTYTYDNLNRRASVSDALGNTTSYQYDPNGNRTRLTDANGKATLYAYDQLNRLITVQDAAGGVVSYGYDAVGNRTSMTDANSHVTTYGYDALNRLASVTDPLGHVVSYGYDAVGNRLTQTKADSTVISYGYDELDRLESLTYPGGAVAYAYDAVGNRTAMTDALGVTAYDYDALDRLVQVAGPNGALGYSYDLYGSRTEITYPGGLTVGYTYDDAGRLIQVSDYASRLTSYDYDDANRPTAIVYPNGVQAIYAYDNADRLLSLVHTSPVSGTVAAAAYTLDNVGNRLSMVDLDGTSSYSYDNLYRLTQVVYPNGETVGYSYDPMGNRTSMTSSLHGVTNYDYDAGDRLLSVTDPGGVTAFTWDANGNMTGKGGAVYTFDALDRLAQVVDGPTTVQFAYDGDGVRLGKTVNGAATGYLQDVAAALPVVLSETTSGQTSRYVYGSDLLMLEDPASALSFYHADGLGSTRALSNLAGQKTDGYSYDVFGATRSHAGSAVQPFTFAGEQIDGELGLLFLRARYYDPSTGRFLAQDPHPGLATYTQSINRYIYAQNNTTFLVDPDGELPHVVVTTAVGAGWGLLSQASTDVFEYIATGDTNVDWKDYAASAAGGAAKGFLVGVGCVGPCTMIVGEATSSVVKTGVHDLLSGERSSFGTYVGNAALSVGAGAMAKYVLPGKGLSSGALRRVLKSGIEVGIKGILDPQIVHAPGMVDFYGGFGAPPSIPK